MLPLRHCSDKRNRYYHAISRNTGCMLSDILKLKIKDIVFKEVNVNHQHAEALINRKIVVDPYYLSILYVKDWLADNQPRCNSNAQLICGLGKRL